MSEMREVRLPGDERANTAIGSVFFIGNATVLIRFAGFTILTDPTFIHMHEETWLGYGLHTKRLTNPAIDIHELPPLDLVLLSHFHGDHFDEVAERELDKSVPIVTTPGSAKDLAARGFETTHALGPWESITFTKADMRLRITSTPGRHGPPLSNAVLPDVMGSIVEFETLAGRLLYRIYITGDTLVIDDLKELPLRYPDLDLALLHLGGTRVLGILVTMDAKQGVEMLELVDPKMAIPIHYNDYDVFKSPLEDFQAEVEVAGLRAQVTYLKHGDTYTFAASTPDLS